MKKSTVILTVFLGLLLSICSNVSGNDVYDKSYFGRQMSEDTFHLFRGVLRQAYRNEPGLENARVQAEAFFDYLATVEQPEFSSYADGDVNENPVGVLWSQLELAMHGKEYNIRVPNDFRKMQLAMRAWNGRANSAFVPELRYQLYYEAYRRLDSSAFLLDQAQKSSFSIFYQHLFSQLSKHIGEGDPWAKSFMSDWVQARIEISRLDWDPQLQEALISKHNLPDTPSSWFPVIMRFNSILPGLLDALEDGDTAQYAWLINGLMDRFQSVGSLIGTALYLCDPHGDATPSSASIELANQGRWRNVFVEEPFPWIDVADYLLWLAEIRLIPPESAPKVVVHADEECVYHESDEFEMPATDKPQRRTITGLHELGFPVERMVSRMTEQERASFCASWPRQSKEVLAQFRYMMHLINVMQRKNPALISDLWQPKAHDNKASQP